MNAPQPTPFEINDSHEAVEIDFKIIEQPNAKVASNGTQRVALLDEGGRMFRRRGVKGLMRKPAGEVLIPLLNQLAGELLANPNVPPTEARGKILALAGVLPTSMPTNKEWVVVELDGVFVYCDGVNVVVSKNGDMKP